jgi:hypothetical protein
MKKAKNNIECKNNSDHNKSDNIRNIDEIIFTDPNYNPDLVPLNEDHNSKKHKNKMSKSGIIATSIISTIAVCSGIILGVYFGQGYFETTNYNYDALSLEDNIEKTMKKYERSNNDYSSFTPSELANIALYRYANYSNTSSVAIGSVKAAGIVQVVHSSNVKSGGAYFNESLSASSLVQVAKRFYQTGDNVAIYNGSNLKDASIASWSENDKEDLTTSDYEEKWGRTLARPLIYVISTKTIIDSTKTINDNGDYVVSFNLDPVKSVVRYVKQMVSMSNLSKTPSFHTVNLSLTLSKDLMLKESNINETYSVYVFGNHESEASLTEKFYTKDETIQIPDLNTNCIY